ncbi:translation initiation factor 3 subunit D, partial [Paragonimus westermani]
GGKKFAFPEPNPFVDDEDDDSNGSDEDGPDSGEDRPRRKEKNKEELGSIGYRYRLFDLGNQITLIVRCEVNGVLPPATNDADLPGQAPAQFVCIRALNEFDSRKDLLHLFPSFGKAMLMAFTFVSRVNPKDSSRHVILGTQQFRPQEFALQLNLNLDNAWGILRCVIDFFMKLPEGKYLMLKDPNKAMLRIFAVPSDAFESDVTTSSDDDVRNEPRKLSDSNEPIAVDSGKETQITNATDS